MKKKKDADGATTMLSREVTSEMKKSLKIYFLEGSLLF